MESKILRLYDRLNEIHIWIILDFESRELIADYIGIKDKISFYNFVEEQINIERLDFELSNDVIYFYNGQFVIESFPRGHTDKFIDSSFDYDEYNIEQIKNEFQINQTILSLLSPDEWPDYNELKNETQHLLSRFLVLKSLSFSKSNEQFKDKIYWTFAELGTVLRPKFRLPDINHELSERLFSLERNLTDLELKSQLNNHSDDHKRMQTDIRRLREKIRYLNQKIENIQWGAYK